MLFHSPRERHQLPLNTFADMASKSTQWNIQTKTVTLPKETESWARKSMDQGSDPQQRCSITISNAFTIQSHLSGTRRKASPGTDLSPLNSQICTGLLQVAENRAYELMQVCPLLSRFLDNFLSCGLKIILGLSFSCQHTCHNYSFLLWSLLGASREPGKALPAPSCANVKNR